MNSVEVKNLSKKYASVPALRNVSLSVEEGKLFALLGPNGAGKTTLMRILTTQIDPTSGQALVFGKDVATQSGEVRGMVSYVPQEMSVWTDITAYENLLIYAKIYGIPGNEREDAIHSALHTMDLQHVADRMVNTYSGGMVRKLEIASAIMVEPKIVFLDEPTIGLDPSARKTVWEKLRWLNRKRGTSVFFCTHYMDEADLYADEIGLISKGRLTKVGTAEGLKSSVSNETIAIEAAAKLDGNLAESVSPAPGHLRRARFREFPENNGEKQRRGDKPCDEPAHEARGEGEVGLLLEADHGRRIPQVHEREGAAHDDWRHQEGKGQDKEKLGGWIWLT